MAEHEKFHYRNLAELTTAIDALGLDLPTNEDLSILASPARLGRLSLPNRLAIHPMEGCDGTSDGAPDELTFRRYERFAAGGAGLIWMEATAVLAEGRANPRQLWLHEGSAAGFAELARRTRSAAANAGCKPLLVLQLTHSGRYSRPAGKPAPIIAHHSAVLDPPLGLAADLPLVSDGHLDALQEAYVRAAVLAAEAGFDAVDVKSCHRYLINELLASHTRANSRYGADYANRTRFLRETMAKLRDAVGDRLEITCRMNVYDGIEYPYGWGVEKPDARAGEAEHEAPFPRPDLTEPIQLIGELVDAGLGCLSVTAGNPYWRPAVNRPADWAAANEPAPAEHPLEGVARLVALTRQVQQAHPKLTVVGAGYTWLRQYLPHFAAAAVARGWATVVGLGRGALAYPDFAADVIGKGGLDRRKVCILCGSCTQIMRDGGRAGCVVRDSEVYAPIYRAGRRRARDTLRELAEKCRRCVDPPCRDACPAGVDIPGFLDAVAAGDEQDAYRILRESILLPGLCGAVCPSEMTCQSACVRRLLADSTVPVGEIHQYVSEHALEAGWAALKAPERPSGRKVAVVGAGPAGLACAAELLERGHNVVVFERAGLAGGKLASVIPLTRLARRQTEKEISAVFAGVEPQRLVWRFSSSLGPERTLDDLLAEGFGAVCLAFGLGNSSALVDGADRCEGVVEAQAFLAQLNNNPDHRVAGDVVVIGGGNTAMDAAVMAKARGAGDVYVLYRRGYGEMPAWLEQRRDALAADVHLLVLSQAIGYVSDASGRLTGVRVVRTRLGEPDASGRRRPAEIPGSESILPAGLAVEAIGETLDEAVAAVLGGVELEAGLVRVDPETLATSRTGVFAAGDLVNGGTTVVQALAEGKKAGIAIDRFLGSGE